MKDLSQYLKESLSNISEGGASGHMSHIIDYDELTLDNLKGVIYSLFNGRVENLTEKLDGTNIQASMNNSGEVIFVRNKADLNSERGGMSIEDMVRKWAGKDRVQKTFVESGRVLELVFRKVGKKFFNPDNNTRIFINAECMIEGTTNIIPYIDSKVSIHDLWIYKKQNDKWVHTETTKEGLKELERAMESIDNVQITPEVMVQMTEDGREIMNKYFVELNRLFKEYGLKDKNTIAEFKRAKFEEWINTNAEWLTSSQTGINMLYDRIIQYNKSNNINTIKKEYPGREADISELDKNATKEIVGYCTKELDAVFLRLGNSIIKLCKGFMNSGGESRVVDELKRNLESTVKEIEAGNSDEAKRAMLHQLDRIGQEEINPTEGIVFTYKGRLMKCTGSFAALNQALNVKYRYK